MTQYMGTIVAVIVAVVLFVLGRPIARLYSDDIVIIGLAADVLKIIAIVNPIMNARFLYSSALRGAGDVKSIAIITTIGMILVRPLVGILLVNVLQLGLAGVWIALSSDFVVCFFVTWLRYRTGKWTQIKI